MAAIILTRCAENGTDRTAQRLVLTPPPNLAEFDPLVRESFEVRYQALLDIQGQAEAEPVEMAWAHGEMGKWYYVFSDGPEAESCFRRAIELDPANDHWTYYLAMVLTKKGEFDEAMAGYRSCLRQNPDNLAAKVRLADLALRTGEDETARGLYRRALAEDPTTVPALIGMARIELNAARPNQAARYLEKALAVQPEVTETRYLLGLAYRDTDRKELAAEFLAAANIANNLKVQPAMEDPYLKDLAEVMESGKTLANRGIRAMKKGDLATAVTWLSRAVAALPENQAIRLQLGRANLLRGDLESAEKDLTMILAANPAHPGAHHLKGLCFEAKGNTAVAEEHYRQAIASDPSHQSARLRLITLLNRRGALAEAAGMLASLLKDHPEDPLAHLQWAVNRIAAGELGEALAGLKGAAELNGADPLYPVLTLRLLAITAKGDTKETATLLQMARDLFGKSPDPIHGETLAMALAAAGDWQEAASLQAAVSASLKKLAKQDHRERAESRLQRYQLRQTALSAWDPGEEELALISGIEVVWP